MVGGHPHRGRVARRDGTPGSRGHGGRRLSSPAPLQADLFAAGPIGLRSDARTEHLELGSGAWVDVTRQLVAGADDVLATLVAVVPWRQGRRPMYDRMVDDPRLSRWYRPGDPEPHAVLDDLRRWLERTYEVAFGGVALNYYRSGSDSVAPHADRELRHVDDTLVAIATFGARRPFLLRPADGGPSVDLRPGSGDLVVMGGSCQRHWHHAVPKVRSAGPRVSASWRWSRATGPAGAAPGRR